MQLSLFFFFALTLLLLFIVFIAGALTYGKKSRVESRLKEAEEFNRRIVESSVDCIKVLALDGTMLSMNQAGLDLISANDPSLVIGKNWLDFWSESEVGKVSAALENARLGRSHRFMGQLKSFDHRDTYWDVIVSPIMGRDGRPERLLAVSRDVSSQRKTEEALREIEVRFMQLADNTEDCFWMWDHEKGRYHYLNPAAAKVYGITIEEMKRDPFGFLLMIHPEDVARVEQSMARQLLGESTVQEFRIKSGEGYKWIRVRARPIADSKGIVTRISGITTDISQEKTAAEIRETLIDNLRISEKRFRDLADAMPQLVWTATPEGSVDYCNKRFEDFSGLPAHVVDSAWGGLIHPEEREYATQTYLDSLRGDKPFEMEQRLQRQDGAYRWLLSRAVPLFDAQMKVLKWFGTSTDVTDMKEALAALKESEDRFLQLAEHVQEGFWIFDIKDARYIYLSPPSEKIFGQSVENLSGLSIEQAVDLFHPEDRMRVIDTLERQMAGEATYIEGRFLRDGAYSWIAIQAFPIADATGTITRVVGVTSDINERKLVDEERERLITELHQAKRLAEEGNQHKTQFLANVSHEIRTPLAVLLGYAELLNQLTQLSDAERRDFIAIILRNGKHLSYLIDDILDLSKVEADKMDVEEIIVSTHELIEEIECIYRRKAEDKGISFRALIENGTPDFILSDPLRLRQILTNIVGNAVKFTHQGFVELRLRSLGCDETGKEQLEIRVRDSGPGISDEQKRNLFQPFTQGELSTPRLYGGSGLGLALCRRLSQLLGGDLLLDFSQPGMGSEFSASFRADVVEFGDDEIRPQDAESGSFQDSLKGLRVLVAEDVPDTQDLIAWILRLKGATVDVVEDGNQAILEIAKQQHDILLMDIQMPTLDGYQAVTEMRRRGVVVPIIALTAHALAAEREKCLRLGFNEHVSKPIDTRCLLQKISDLTNSQQLL